MPAAGAAAGGPAGAVTDRSHPLRAAPHLVRIRCRSRPALPGRLRREVNGG
jgi:hypothetical protein